MTRTPDLTEILGRLASLEDRLTDRIDDHDARLDAIASAEIFKRFASIEDRLRLIEQNERVGSLAIGNDKSAARIDVVDLAPVDSAPGVTFLVALASRRPMRRGNGRPNLIGPWLYLGEDSSGVPTWLRIDTGQHVGLHAFDYEATDWEIMP